MLRSAARLGPLALAAALALTSCPGGRRGPPPERFLPAAVRAAVVLPEARRAAKDLGALQATLSGFPGVGDAVALRGALAAQLGFDPLDADALERAGFDPGRGAALALLEGEGAPALLVLPVGDAPKVEALVARLARERLGAEERAAEAHGSASVVTFRHAAGEAPAIAYAVLERYALVAAGPSGAAAVAAACTLAPEAALASAPEWSRARRALGDQEAALAFLPSRFAAASLPPLRDGAAIGLSASVGRLRLRAAVLLGDRAAAYGKLSAAGAASKLAVRLAPGAMLVARWDGDFAALGERLLPLLPVREREALAVRGLDLSRDVFGVLAPGGALSLSLAPSFSLAGLGWPVLLLDPPRVLEFEVLVPVKAGAEEAATRWARYADPARPPRPGPDGVTRVPTPSGEIAWTLRGGRLALAGGRPGRLEALLARADGEGAGWQPPAPDAKAALSGGLGGLVFDVPRLASGVRALPPASFGQGPTGFVVRSVVDRFLEPTSRFAAVSLRADLAEGALLVSLELIARAAGGTP